MDCRWVHIIPPEVTKLSDNELLKSLDQIHGWQGSNGPFETNLIEQCERACAGPLEELKLPDIHTLVGQGIGLETLLKITIPIVEAAPWIEADVYSGDLVTTLVQIDNSVHQVEPEYIKRLRMPVRKLLAIFREEKKYHYNHPEIYDRDYWADEFVVDMERFLTKWSLNFE
jgi:CDI immunity proteins